jgi:SAM-dependent methyltransferase
MERSEAKLFNPRLLKSHRERALQLGFDSRLFAYAGKQLRDRFTALTVSFSRVLDLSPLHTGGLSPFFQDLFPVDSWHHISSQHLFQETPKSYDLVLSALDGHWIEDLPLFLQCARALLKPRGLFIGTFWGGDTLKELRHALLEAEISLKGGVSPRIIPMIPLEESARLLQEAPFVLPMADQETLTILYSTTKGLFHHLKTMGERNALTAINRAPKTLFLETEKFYRRLYATPEGELPATAQLITLSAWAPD